jgi:hypothetical protein
MTIIDFTADSDGLTVKIQHTAEPTDVTFTLADGTTTANVASPSISADPYWTFVYATDASDGVYSVDVEPTASLGTAVIANITSAVHGLLRKTLNEDYDIRLMQEIEAVKQYIVLQEEVLARNIYAEVLKQIASCVTESIEDLQYVGVHIINNNFTIV